VSLYLKTLEANGKVDRTPVALDMQGMARVEAHGRAVVVLACTTGERSQERSLLRRISDLCATKDIVSVELRRSDCLVFASALGR